MNYKTSCNAVFSCKYHVVWCPKYRRKVLVGDISTRLKDLLPQLAKDCGIEILELEIMPDHIHLLMEIPPSVAIQKAIQHLKGASSHILRSEYPRLTAKLPSLWTNSYFVSSVGGAPLSVVKQYIENQNK